MVEEEILERREAREKVVEGCGRNGRDDKEGSRDIWE